MNKHTLYYSQFCYFCQKVLMFLKKNSSLNVELRSTSSREHATQLMQGGGKTQVPCLRVESSSGEVQWMYESDDIIAYLGSV